jgi:hypothetical protein
MHCLSTSLTADAVVVDLGPIDLLAGDWEYTTQGLECCITHGGVAMIQSVLEVGLGALDGLDDVLADLGLNQSIESSPNHISIESKAQRDKTSQDNKSVGGRQRAAKVRKHTPPSAEMVFLNSVLSCTLPSS